MYEVFFFRGGVYKFDELVEYIEDVGGMVINKNCFEIIRGDSYLSTEVHVLLIVPENEVGHTKSLIGEIKGIVDEVKVTEEQKRLLSSYLSIYDALNKTDVWTEKGSLKDFITCPCYALLCAQIGDEECQLDDKLERILEEMCANDIIERKLSEGKSQYRLKRED